MSRDSRQAYRRRAADTERMVDAAVASVKAERDTEYRRAADVARIDATRSVDPAALVVGCEVRDVLGWHRVRRVNARSVTVLESIGVSGREFTKTIGFERLREVRP